MELAGNAGGRDKETGPAVSVEAPRRRSLEEVTGKVAGNGELSGELRAVQGQAPVKQVLQFCGEHVAIVCSTLTQFISTLYHGHVFKVCMELHRKY